MKIPNPDFVADKLTVSLARIVSEDSQQSYPKESADGKSSKDS